MRIARIDDLSAPELADYTQLTDVALRRVREPEEGLYLAESPKVIERALRAGHRPRSVLLLEEWLPRVEPLLEAHPDVAVYVGEPGQLEALTGFHLHRGALASMHRPAPLDPLELLRSSRRVVVLEDLADHTNVEGSKKSVETIFESLRTRIAVLENLTDHANVGSAFRSAAAMGLDAVLVTPSCADPLYRRSVRVSMGTVFQVPWTRIDPWPRGGVQLLKDAGYVVAGMSLGEESITLDQLVAEDHEALALVFGTEGHGLMKATDRQLDRRVTIPMMNGVDSLNVAASSAVAFYATR
ncbi:RNA methyltransferase [Leucobacter sp. wl10]|uniref:TrmH family RNA methyltransferase n=1 Tax=Leucobacter sp. wl10 TaxID=2304677 RepID=UPI000E5C1168|nr:RNA methyltransferase [Leucobacter sp. wl10]RGE17954.1 RNA methyltransferase [Leucobacter sp. wl10]